MPPSRLLSPLLLPFALAVAISTTCTAQVELETLSPPKTGAPGDFVTHVFGVRNLGARETFHFELELPPGLSPVSLPPPVTLETGEEARVFVTVFITPAAQAGVNIITLTATDTSYAQATAVIEVLPVAAVEVIPPPDTSADPGEEVVLPFTVVNRGNVQDEYAISASSALGFELEIELELDPPEGVIALSPGEERTVTVVLEIPEDAKPGRDWVTLTATSLGFAGVSASGTAVVIILPPPPQAVGTTLFLELPSEVSLRLERDLPELERVSTARLDFKSSGSFDGSRFELRASLSDLLRTWSTRDYSLRWEAPLLGFTPLRLSLAREVDEEREERVIEAELEGAAKAALLGLGLRRAIREGLVRESILSLSFSSLTEPFRLALESELGRIEGLFDQSTLLGAEFEREGISLALRAGRIGPLFPGGDEEAVELSGDISLPSCLAAHWSYSISHDNVEGDPGRPTVTTTVSQGYLRLALGGLPSLSSGFSAERSWSSPAGLPPTIDEWHRERALRLSQRLGPLSYSILGRQEEDIDLVSGTELERLSFTERFTVELAEWLQGELWLAQEVWRDLGAGTQSSSSRVSVTLNLEGSPISASLTLALEDGSIGFASRLAGRIARDLAFSLRGEGEIADGSATFDATWDFSLSFLLPLPFIVVKGRVEGYVFIDEDGDGERDPGEPGVPGLILSIDGTEVRSNTGREGFFRFPPLLPGRYELVIENLPVGLAPAIPLPVEIELEEGEVLQLELPLRRVAAIVGVVFDDADRDGVRDRGERGLPGVRVVLEGVSEMEIFTDPEGGFAFTELLPGRYLVWLDVATLPERYEPTTPTEVEVQLEPGEVAEVEFGAAERPRPVIITYQPPVAEFTWSPEEPRAGERVIFDGSASYDPDGEIVRYEWDFTGDDITDAEGKVVEWVFPEPGAYPVELTVTDDDGYTGSVRKIVTIRST